MDPTVWETHSKHIGFLRMSRNHQWMHIRVAACRFKIILLCFSLTKKKKTKIALCFHTLSNSPERSWQIRGGTDSATQPKVCRAEDTDCSIQETCVYQLAITWECRMCDWSWWFPHWPLKNTNNRKGFEMQGERARDRALYFAKKTCFMHSSFVVSYIASCVSWTTRKCTWSWWNWTRVSENAPVDLPCGICRTLLFCFSHPSVFHTQSCTCLLIMLLLLYHHLNSWLYWHESAAVPERLLQTKQERLVRWRRRGRLFSWNVL